MRDVLNNWQFEDAERIGAVRSYGRAANGEYERAPKIDKGQWDHGHRAVPVLSEWLEWLAWLPEQRRGRSGRCSDDSVKL
jgi:hypothetical protein